jgi:hypothetical protein
VRRWPYERGLTRRSLLKASSALLSSRVPVFARPSPSPLGAPAQGTILLAIPTREGLVVAADSRLTGDNKICDRMYKIVELTGVDRSALMLAGVEGFAVSRRGGELCGRTLYVNYLSMLKSLIEGRPDHNVDAAVYALVDTIRDQLKDDRYIMRKLLIEDKFQRVRPDVNFVPYIQIVFAQYNPDSGFSYVTEFYVNMTRDLHFSINGPSRRVRSPSDAREIFVYGETNFVRNQVLHASGSGQLYLNAETMKFLLESTAPISSISKETATVVANNVVHAAYMASLLAPLAVNDDIGGPTDIVFLGEPARPQRIQWK